MRYVAKFVRDKIQGPLVVAEIGVEKGLHAAGMLTNMNIKKLYLVDHYLAYQDCSSQVVSQETNDYEYSVMFKNLWNYFDKIVLVTKPSVFAATLFPDEFFDFVYIDANHDYEYVRQDIYSWWSKVKVGGILGGHDYKGIPHVERAVKEFVAEYKLEIIEFLTDERHTEWGIEKHG